MELKEKDNTDSSKEDTKPEDWGVMFSRMMKTYPALTIEGICNLSYPQFKTLYQNIYNKDTFTFTIPFLGSEEKPEEIADKAKEEAKEANLTEAKKMIAMMNSEVMGGR